jgi:hypothetical protein
MLEYFKTKKDQKVTQIKSQEKNHCQFGDPWNGSHQVLSLVQIIRDIQTYKRECRQWPKPEGERP